jgi:hypothetical protein
MRRARGDKSAALRNAVQAVQLEGATVRRLAQDYAAFRLVTCLLLLCGRLVLVSLVMVVSGGRSVHCILHSNYWLLGSGIQHVTEYWCWAKWRLELGAIS